MTDDPTYRRPESVLVVVYTRFGETLLLKRCKPFEFWQSVTGSLDAGEGHADTAARELLEETGIAAGDRLTFSGKTREFAIEPRWRNRYAPGTTHNTEYEWRLLLDDVREIRLDSEEHSDFRWVPIGEAIDTVWSNTNREALQSLRNDFA